MTTRTTARRSVTALASLALILTTPALTAPARADSGPGAPADTRPPLKIDADDPDLRMPEGAKLAAGRVLDIKSVVETDDGDERREDTNTKVSFALQAEVLFGKDSSKLGSEANARIQQIADEAERQDAKSVRVFGFTDNLGSAAHGLELSRKRADAVQQRLADSLDSSVAYQIRGYGEQYPIADNATEEGRKKNRRVEVSFPRGS
ncbi:OmpA family protein [Streptomyces botrytidirepellens]|uniref:OmpA family protein n=1 Tax=Streptomyces botrytidirepellens TaxID=2486417 RepID=A0A3M8XCY4_9ACTN|nr:OmpA family protein [Streptomyces botrytidirepellens]RNG39419.1 OmpA family protein [Streptomyces botrytidirepellens]